MSLLVGCDVGTFMDVVLYDDVVGEFFATKVPTTSEDASVGLNEGLKRLPTPLSQSTI